MYLAFQIKENNEDILSLPSSKWAEQNNKVTLQNWLEISSNKLF